MKIEYTHKAEDYIVFNKVARKGQSQFWNFAIVFGCIIGFLALINWSTAFWIQFGDYQHAVQIGALFLGLFILRFFVKRRATEKFEQEFQNSIMANPINIHFNDDGVTSEQINQRTIWNWAAFHKVSLQNKDIFLWYDKMQAVMIPSRAIENDEKRDELMVYLKEKIHLASASN